MSRIVRMALLATLVALPLVSMVACGGKSGVVGPGVDGRDTDGDGILNDGNGDGVPNTFRCSGGNTAACDDNCPDTPNADQADPDNDSIGSACDNCPNAANVSQQDDDGDGIGNACDIVDTDLDGILNDFDGDGVYEPCRGGNATACDDNCINTPNADQADPDDDAIGSACDNCPNAANGDQLNTDGDAQGDACDPDDDNDGVADGADNAPLNPRSCQDTDLDGCDDCSQNPVSSASPRPWATYMPSTTNDAADLDGDGTCDGGDLDDDNDGVPDAADANATDPRVCRDTDADTCNDCSQNPVSTASPRPWAPYTPSTTNDGTDTDGDGSCNAGDADDDNDGVADGADANATDPQVCRDQDADSCNDCSQNPSSTASPTPWPAFVPSTSADGTDTDGDGICDAGDVCPGDPANDADNDGLCAGTGFKPPKTGDNDPCPNNPNTTATDADPDGDGISGCVDNCPTVSNTTQLNADLDSRGDACDNCPNFMSEDFSDLNNNTFGDVCERYATFTITAVEPGQTLNSFTVFSKDLANDGYIYRCAAKGAGIPTFDCGNPPDFPPPPSTDDASDRTVGALCAGSDTTADSIELIKFTYVYRDNRVPTCADIDVPAAGSEYLDENLNNYNPTIVCTVTTSSTSPCP